MSKMWCCGMVMLLSLPAFCQSLNGVPNQSVSGSLPNGTTATTQSALDNSTKLSTTAYTDAAVSTALAGVNPAVAVLAASTANLTGTYVQVGGGVGDTFTITATGAFTLDGIAINTTGQRVLLKNQSTASQNGVYTATVAGTTGVSPVFTRATDYDMPSDVNNTGSIPVQSGTVNATTGWLLTSQVTSIGSSGSALTYTQFSYSPSNVAITGGTINNTVIGGTTPAAVTCTVCTASASGAGVLTLNGATSGTATITAPSIAGTATNPFVFSNNISSPNYPTAGTYYQAEGYAGNAQAASPNATYCSGIIIPPGGLSVGHIVVDITTSDATHAGDIGFYSAAGTLEAHIGAQDFPTGSNQTFAFSGGTQTLVAGKTYFCITTTTSGVIALNLRSQSATFFSYATVSSVTSGGALNSTITPPADTPNASSTATSGSFILLP